MEIRGASDLFEELIDDPDIALDDTNVADALNILGLEAYMRAGEDVRGVWASTIRTQEYPLDIDDVYPVASVGRGMLIYAVAKFNDPDLDWTIHLENMEIGGPLGEIIPVISIGTPHEMVVPFGDDIVDASLFSSGMGILCSPIAVVDSIYPASGTNAFNTRDELKEWIEASGLTDEIPPERFRQLFEPGSDFIAYAEIVGDMRQERILIESIFRIQLLELVGNIIIDNIPPSGC